MRGRFVRGLIAALLTYLSVLATALPAAANGALLMKMHPNTATGAATPPSFVKVSYFGGSNFTTSGVNLTYPSGPVAGDYVFMFMTTLSNGCATSGVGPPIGYTLAIYTTPNQCIELAYKKLDGTESGTVNVGMNINSGNNPWFASLSYWHNVKSTGTPYESLGVTQVVGGVSPSIIGLTSDSITTTGANEIAVVFWGVGNRFEAGDQGSTPATGWTVSTGGDTWVDWGPNSAGKSPIDSQGVASPTTVAGENRTFSVSSGGNQMAAVSLALIGQ